MRAESRKLCIFILKNEPFTTKLVGVYKLGTRPNTNTSASREGMRSYSLSKRRMKSPENSRA